MQRTLPTLATAAADISSGALLIKDTSAAFSQEIVSLPVPTSFTPCK